MTRATTPAVERIVVGLDGSEPSLNALRWAGRMAVLIGAQVDVITSWEYPVSYGVAAVPVDWRPDLDAAEVASAAIETVFGADVPAGLHAEVVEGHPAKVLLDASKGASMLVVGSRGHGGFTGLLLGSVSSQCAELATCPVVVVHGQST
jgi:nucleotide-binding universal stress UspA family protein